MTANLVCILTAGKGTRMGAYSEHLNKALLPLGKKAVITHIIERFPPDSEFVVALGHRAEQVRTYLELAHPNLKFSFVNVDNFDAPGSGPGYSVKACQEHLQAPFFYVSCDTLWAKTQVFPTHTDWFGVAHVDESQSAAYCNFESDSSDLIVRIHDKVRVSGTAFRAFVGIGFIKDFRRFWQGLLNPELIRGELQVSNGIQALVDARSAQALEIAAWQDIGDAEKYRCAAKEYEAFDFSKFDEALYLTGGRVIKYFADHTSAERRVNRAKANPKVFPQVSDCRSGFYDYPFLQGKTLYQRCTPLLFSAALNWLDSNLWHKVEAPPADVRQVCRRFYRDKTLERIEKFFKKYAWRDKHLIVNSLEVAPLTELLERVDWEDLYDGKAVFFHGDLHFDHIISSPDGASFALLDWRHDFGGQTSFGDIYYDLAKMQGGFILNYDLIKANLFSYEEDGAQIYLDFPSRTQGAVYSRQLETYVESRNLSWQKVRMLVPIIYLNMAPLHHYPFDKFLFALGNRLLQSELCSDLRSAGTTDVRVGV